MQFMLPEEGLFKVETGTAFLAKLRAKATDMVLCTALDDGFFTDSDNYTNYFVRGGNSVDHFGRISSCACSAIRPFCALESKDESLLKKTRDFANTGLVEYGEYPQTVIDAQLKELVEHEYIADRLETTGKSYYLPDGRALKEYTFNGKRMVRVEITNSCSTGYIQLSDGESYTAGTHVFIEVKPVQWLVDQTDNVMLSASVIGAGCGFEEAQNWTSEKLPENIFTGNEGTGDYNFKYLAHDEIETINAYVKANIPVFIHGLSGDGKSDRVHEVDPNALDIELVNETPETINGKIIYNEAKDEIRDVKPAWLVELETMCEDGKIHVLFFDELTNATKQTQSIIFKIILQRIVNNRWKLPDNVRIIAAGNDRSESSVAHDLAEPLFGRFAHVYIHTTVENWMPWAMTHRINPYVMEFLANHSWFIRTDFTGEEANADPRRWEMASKILDASENDFGLLEPVVGHEIAEEFIAFFKSQKTIFTIANYTDEEIGAMNAARRYQLAQQCLNVSDQRLEEARTLVGRLGKEYLAWFDYTKGRKANL